MDIINLSANIKLTKFEVDISNSFREIKVLIFGKIVILSKRHILAFLTYNKSKNIHNTMFKTTLIANFEHIHNIEAKKELQIILHSLKNKVIKRHF